MSIEASVEAGIEAGTRPPKVLITKIGLDGHDRGSRLVASTLRDAGMEVVYTGPWKQIPEVLAIAEEEDVDVIGISSLASDHLLVPKLMQALRAAELGHVKVIVGGIVPTPDIALLTEAGVAGIFHPGTPMQAIVDDVARLAHEARSAARRLVDQ